MIVVGFIDEDFDRSLTAYRPTEGFNKPTFVLDDGQLRRMEPDDRPVALVRRLERVSAVWSLGRLFMRRLGFHFPLGEWWRVNTAILKQIHEDSRAAGIPVLFIRIPNRLPRAFPQLQSFMREIGADYLDLADYLAQPGTLHFAADDHIDERGHRYVAEAAAEWIEAQLAKHR